MITNEPVKLRQKQLKSGNISLYLDVYYNGIRRYEFLKLYLKPDVKQNKAYNTNVWRLANAVKAKRIIEVQNNKYGFFVSTNQNKDICEYMVKRAEKVMKHGRTTKDHAKRVANLLRIFTARDYVPFKIIDKNFVLRFIEFLRKEVTHPVTKNPLSPTTIWCHYKMLVATLNRAVKDEIISENPVSKIATEDKPKAENKPRNYLTLDELQRLCATKCENSKYRAMFLFGCFTGLRLSDILALRWENLTYSPSGSVTVEIVQQKTQEVVHLPLSQSAVDVLPEVEQRKGYVFGGVGCTRLRTIIQKWVNDAGINKKITFHCSRHTYATMLLTLGADLYTVSKLLGHKKIDTTQIYAKIVDSKKREAVELIPTFNGVDTKKKNI